MKSAPSCSCSTILLILAVFAFFYFIGRASADADSCFPHKTLYTATPIDIRASDSRFSASRGRTATHKTYTVHWAKNDSLFGSCWIKIDNGWILRRSTGSAIKPGTPELESASATDTGSKCYAHNTGYNSIESTIRARPAYGEEVVGTLSVKASFDVLESREAENGACWLRISQGWIRDTLVRASEDRTSTATSVSKCYTASKAYITGSMNIRSGPSTSNSKVGSAKTGESFTVLQSQRGGDYCWLKISKGWLAKTARVRSTKPPPYSPSSTNTSRLPRIEGDASFRSQIVQAFNYLRDRASNWFNYVVAKISSVEPYWGPGALVESNSGLLLINSSIFTSAMQRASVLVHEACHVYQRHEGRSERLGHEGREWECTQKQIDFVKQVEPGARTWLSVLRRYQQHPY